MALRAPPLRRDATADVLVIGAGISGAMIAESLTDAGLRVIIVDKREAVSGATTASTALLQYEIDVPMCQLSERVGSKRALRLWRRSHLALDALRSRSRRLDIDAGFRDRDSLYLQGDLLDEAGLRREAAMRREAGFDVQWLSSRQVRQQFGIAHRAGLLGFGSMSCDPRRLAIGYLQAARRRGARLYAHTEVSAVQPGRRGVLASTVSGPTVKAGHLVFATGYEIGRGVPRKGHRIRSTWAIATHPQPAWPSGCLIWEASESYLYLRPGPHGRVICGGEDEDFKDAGHRDSLTPQKARALERKLHALLPKLDQRAALAWSGSFGSSPTGTPSMGAVPGMPGCYAVLGYGGNGITFSAAAAQLLRAQITGEGDVDADLFSFHRRWPALHGQR
ncbi:MAG TPA: FAD-dependent oxidoreductase [Steroidobacteraceae bacterium]|nr:FAD-dependent oxidoreductase [Steroidobacteraceae bacterium]